jgi:hypothetical protein
MLISMFKVRSSGFGVVTVTLIIIFTPCAPAQQLSTPNEEKAGNAMFGSSNPDDQRILEEVIVIGRDSASTIRRELFNTQDIVYDMFNELNKDDAFDMVCEKEARIGSQIVNKVCRPRFLLTAVSNAYVDWRDDGEFGVNRAEMRNKALRQREIMADLANKNPQFLSILKKRLALRKAYESKIAPDWSQGEEPE